MFIDQYHRVDLTHQFLVCIKRYSPSEFHQSIRFTLIEILEFVYDAVMRGGFLPDANILLDDGTSVLPDDLWEPFVDQLYDMVRYTLEECLGLTSSTTNLLSNKYALTNVRLSFDVTTDLPTSVTLLILESGVCIE